MTATTTPPSVVGPAAAIRAYIVALRQARGMTQNEVAQIVNLKRRAYIDWETGVTEDLKAAAMCAAFRALNASFDHLRDLARPEATVDDGRRMAGVRLREEAANELAAYRDSHTDEELDAYMAELEKQAISSTQILAQLRALLRRRSSDG